MMSMSSYSVASRGWWNVQLVALVQNKGFEMELGSGSAECIEDAITNENCYHINL
jgi:hypothetical protein